MSDHGPITPEQWLGKLFSSLLTPAGSHARAEELPKAPPPPPEDKADPVDAIFQVLLRSPKVQQALGIWLVDSGCSDHITGGELATRTADCKTAYATASGTVTPSGIGESLSSATWEGTLSANRGLPLLKRRRRSRLRRSTSGRGLG